MPVAGDPGERVTLYVEAGDLERRGVALNALTDTYDAVAALSTESQYLVGGARVVWQSAAAGWPSAELERGVRVTVPVSDLTGSSTAVLDLRSGVMVEADSFAPNGQRETYSADGAVGPEPMGFSGKEGDEEIGVTYFGQRYLLPRIGRWATPDPMEIDGLGGGEVINAYHYLGAGLLQSRDPIGLDEYSCRAADDGSGDEANMSTPEGGTPHATPPPPPPPRRSLRGQARVVADEMAIAQAPTAEKPLAWLGSYLERGADAAHDAIWTSDSERAYQSSVASGAPRVGDANTDPVSGAAAAALNPIVEATPAVSASLLACLPGPGAAAPGGLAFTTEVEIDEALAAQPRTFNPNPMAGATDGEIQACVDARPSYAPSSSDPWSEYEIGSAASAPGTSDLMISAARAPSNARYNVSNGMMVNDTNVPSQSSAAGSTKIVSTHIRVHTADPAAPPGSNSATGNTVSITQASGGRRLIPGQGWVQTSTATDAEMNESHIPIHR